ncbi:MAG: UvrB/UvrC motif-containing protein [Clostridia bacterium]|nr:UvrB/UvrC motif-containing protein [Clostridia bacterium]
MLCQSCKNKQATTHIKSIVNGELTEMNLCSECAAKNGYGNVFEHFFDIGSLMSGFMGEPSSLAVETHCPNCGVTFAQISKGGRVGCAKCYDVFYDRLLPSIKRIHGNTVHTGKRLRKPQLQSGSAAVSEAEPAKQPSKLDILNEKLKTAIEKQEFEQAAKLRDEINEIKNSMGGNQ